MLIKRRDFLKVSSLATASLMMPNFLKSMTFPEAFDKENKILVILQLSGGNDGLNTIIPTKNDIYFREREMISIKDSLKLTEEAMKVEDPSYLTSWLESEDHSLKDRSQE